MVEGRPPIFLVTGAPATGKTTLCRALMQTYAFGIHIPGDDLREWVVSGIAGPLDWTDETTRQFELAAEAAADIAVRYNDAGFAVAFDHCQWPTPLELLAERRFQGRRLLKIILSCDLQVNLQRNLERTTKQFDPSVLAATIEGLNASFRDAAPSLPGWHVHDNTSLDVKASVRKLRALGDDLPE